MTDADRDGSVTAPTDVFELLCDETRLAIVRELAKARRSNWAWRGETFADLRRAVGVADAGNFSYHLSKLRGPLVVKDGDEYKLRNTGLRLVGAVEADSFTRSGEPDTATTEYDCPHPTCDESLRATYADQYFRLHCPGHDVHVGTMLPPGVAEHLAVADLVGMAVIESRGDVERARAGVCPHCWGPTTASFPASSVELPDVFDAELPADAVMATFGCDRCGMAFDVTAGACVVDHPAVVSLYHDHGVDVRERPYTEFPFLSPTHPVVESGDPTRVRIDVEVEADVLHLWLDGETDVVEYERE